MFAHMIGLYGDSHVVTVMCHQMSVCSVPVKWSPRHYRTCA